MILQKGLFKGMMNNTRNIKIVMNHKQLLRFKLLNQIAESIYHRNRNHV